MRAELLQETERFLDRGGEVENIPGGVSGKNPGDLRCSSTRLFIEPPAPRTPILKSAAIEARRGLTMRRRPVAKSRLPQPRRKIIYDDFGEPLRRVWVEDD